MNEQNNLSFTKLLLLIFIPSLVSTALYVTIGTYWQGVPSICLFLIIFAFTLLPFELGVVLYANKKRSGKLGLSNNLQKQGLFVPVVVSVLFSLYHLWLPFNNVFRITVFTVAYVITYKKKDIGIVIVFHCLCNLFSSVSFIVSVFS